MKYFISLLLLASVLFCPRIFGHSSVGPAKFYATFEFSSDPTVYLLDTAQRSKDQRRWNGWSCFLWRTKNDTVETTSESVFEMKVRCFKLNMFVEAKASCGIGSSDIREVMSGTKMDSVQIRLHCDGGPAIPDDSEEG